MGGGGLLSWKSRQEGGSCASGNPGERGVKKQPHPSGGCGFFLE